MKESVKKIVVFTGAGVSADSGLSTFRDADGLWDKYRIEDVCTPEALARNREKVVEFYNIRRRELLGRMGYEFQICSPDVDEHVSGHARDIVRTLAVRKARGRQSFLSRHAPRSAATQCAS